MTCPYCYSRTFPAMLYLETHENKCKNATINRTLMSIFYVLVKPHTSCSPKQLFISMKQQKKTLKKGFWWWHNDLFTRMSRKITCLVAVCSAAVFWLTTALNRDLYSSTLRGHDHTMIIKRRVYSQSHSVTVVIVRVIDSVFWWN